MLIPGWAWEALLDAGLRATQVTDDLVTLWSEQRPEERQLTRVRTLKQRRGPKQVQQIVRDTSASDATQLLIAEGLTPSEQEQLTRAGWAWLSGPTPHQPLMGSIVLANDNVTIRQPGLRDTQTRSPRGRHPWGALMLQKQLLTGEAFAQSALVDITGLTQARVSQVLRELKNLELVGSLGTHPEVQWICTNRGALLARWLDAYRGAGGVTTYWLGLADLDEQVHTAAHALNAASVAANDHRGFVVSGDPAAQEYSPWRRPVKAVIYAHLGADLSEAGLVPTGPEEATLELSVPKDPGVWPSKAVARLITRLRPSPPYPLADPFQTMTDLRRIGGPDADQAFDALKNWVLRDINLEAGR